MTRSKSFLLALAWVLAGCVTVDPAERRLTADAIAERAGWQALRLEAGEFVLAAYVPPPVLGGVPLLTIYVEGDGFAYVTPSQASLDPTPRDPLALKLALQDRSGASAWLGRPCQYVTGDARRNCEVRYWTTHRFAEVVVAASDQAIEQLKARAGARSLALVGYSGGGAIAALVAARRHDVVRLITVAGNLDHVEWTRWHAVAPLSGSLNAADAWRALQAIPQVHWVGGRDPIVGRGVADAYAARFAPGLRPSIREVASADHSCCWVERWPELLRESWQ